MRITFKETLAALSVISLLALYGACGQKSEESTEGEEASTASLTEEAESLPIEAVPFTPEIEAAGYEVSFYTDYPATVAGKVGKMVLYGSASGGQDGGMIYVEESGSGYGWVWHWYLEDASPVSINHAEINEDGLWDIQVRTKDQRQLEFAQDDSFALIGGAREDRIALNGTSSDPLENHPLWHCFDGNIYSSFQSDAGGRNRPFIEVASPFGLADGILSIHLLEANQPKDCDLLADGEKVQSFQLQATTGEQLIQLDAVFKTAKRIRMEVNSCHGDSRVAAIAELSIR